MNIFEFRSQLRQYIRLELVAGRYVLFYLSLVVGRAISLAAFSKNSKMFYTSVHNARRKFFIPAIFNWWSLHAKFASSWSIQYLKINWKMVKCTVFIWNRIWNYSPVITWIRISYRGNFWKFFAAVFVKSDEYLACRHHWDSFLFQVDYFVNEKFKSLNKLLWSFLIINPKPCKIGTCASLFPKSLLRVVT